jgi:hypothetical protein
MIDRLLQPHLEPIARDFRRWQLWRCLAWCWAISAATGLGLLLVLRFASSSWPLAFPLLLIASLIAAAITVRRCRKISTDYRALAREIERENPQLHALLLTAVEQQPQSPDGGLNYLQQRVIDAAVEHHRQSPWGRKIAQRLSVAQRAHWLALCAFAVVMAGLWPRLARPGELWAGAERSGSVVVTPGDASVERGSGFVVLARFDGKLPPEATLVITPVNENSRRIPLTKNLADPVFGGGIPEVKGDLKYHVEYPAGQTRDFKVTVFEYPRLERADAKITYPAYTHLPDKTIQDTRRVSAVEGSSVGYSFRLNKQVTTAKLVAKDNSIIPLTGDTNNHTLYHAQFKLEQSHRYELLLVDDAGRTNKLPPDFVFAALSNRPPELKLTFPRGDQRVSSLEEISFQGQASGDYGLHAYGIAYTLGGGDPKTVELGHDSNANEKRSLTYVLPLESLEAQPDQLLSYYLWADDTGPDGRPRRTSGDLFFAEIKPFDEIFREGQSAEANNNDSQNGGGQQGNQTEKLSELQKQITTATWNLKRRENAPQPSAKFKDDAAVVRDSQQQALEQARALQEGMDDPRMKGFVDTATKAMEQAEKQLSEATEKNAVPPLGPALSEEQTASQALLRLQAREYQVARNSRSQRGSARGGQRSQQQLEQLDLKQAENRYETQSEAARPQSQEQREQLQVANRLKELAQRQQDLNERLKELQASLQQAKTEQERNEIRERLKRLREEQQDLLSDTDELRQRMERPENAARMADSRQQLEQTRAEEQRAAEALDKDAVPQALTSGTRAQRELQQLQDDFRRKNSGEFSDAMRQMRDQARQLAKDEEQIGKKLEQLGDPAQKTLDDADQRREVGGQLLKQEAALTNLFTQMRQVSEQSETAQPLLSKQLYDMVRQNNQEAINESIEKSSELLQRGFVPQAAPFEQRVHTNIDQLKTGVERAAESVLGDDTEALRLARRELEDLSRQLEREMTQATGERGTNAAGRNADGSARQLASSGRTGTNSTQAADERSPQQGRNGQSRSEQQTGEQGQARSGQQGQGEPGQQQAQVGSGRDGRQPGSQDQQGESGSGLASENSRQGGAQEAGNAQAGGGAREAGDRNGARDGARSAGGLNNLGPNGGWAGGGWGGANWTGPLVGEDFVDWTDRLRDVEEMVDYTDLRTEVARIRDRARAVRLDYKKFGKKPDWAVVKTQIAEPLAEVRSRISEELARRGSKEALVPLDRDPVPAEYAERVRRYYEELGKSEPQAPAQKGGFE